MFSAYFVSRFVVAVSSRWKVGSALIASASSVLRRPVVLNTRSEFEISDVSCPCCSVSAASTSAVEPENSLSAADCWSRTVSVFVSSSSNPGRLPISSETSAERPVKAIACCSIQFDSSLRVFGSNVRRISSSSTVGDTWAFASAPPSAIALAPLVPGVSWM